MRDIIVERNYFYGDPAGSDNRALIGELSNGTDITLRNNIVDIRGGYTRTKRFVHVHPPTGGTGGIGPLMMLRIEVGTRQFMPIRIWAIPWPRRPRGSISRRN